MALNKRDTYGGEIKPLCPDDLFTDLFSNLHVSLPPLFTPEASFPFHCTILMMRHTPARRLIRDYLTAYSPIAPSHPPSLPSINHCIHATAPLPAPPPHHQIVHGTTAKQQRLTPPISSYNVNPTA